VNRVLQVVLTGNDGNLRSVLARSASEVKAYERTVSSANQGIARTSSTAGVAMKAAAATVGVLAIALGYGVVKAAQFDKAMRNVNSLAGLNEKALATLSDQVVAMSTRLPQSAETLAEGLYDIVGSGFQAADAMTVLDAAAQAASAGLTTTEVSAKAITGVLNAYGLEASDASDVSDILFQTVNLGVLSFDELAGSIGDVVGTAAAAKVSIDQVGAAIATMTLTGISGAESATSLNNLLQSMIKPSEALADKFHELGYESGAQALATDGLRGVMEKLRISTGGNVTELLHLFPNIRAARGALALLSNEGQNYARVSADLEDKNKRQGATARVLAEQMKAASNQFQLLKNQFDAGAITVGTKLLPALITLIGVFRTVGGFVADVATDVANRLEPAWDALVRAGEAVWKILVATYEAAAPIVGAMLKIGGAAVIGVLTVLAKALANVLEFLADNRELGIAVAIVMAARLLPSLVAIQVAFNRLILTPLVLFLSNALSAAGTLAGFLSGGFRAALGAARTAVVGLITSLTPIAAIAATVYGVGRIIEFTKATENARKEVDDMFAAFKAADDNVARITALQDGISALQERIADAKADLASFDDVSGWDQLLFGAPLSNAMDITEDSKALEVYQQALQEALDKQRNLTQNLRILAETFRLTRDEVIAFADDAAVPYVTAAGEIKTANIDLTDSASKVQYQFGLMRHLEFGETKDAIEQQLIAALGTLADEASTAAEKIDAVREALDLLTGKTVTTFEAQSDLAAAVAQAKGALDGLTGSVLTANGGLNAQTEAGRKAGEILIDVRDKGNKLIETMLRNGATSEEVAKADADLRESFIQTAGQMGIGRAAAEKLADQILGIPSERKTQFDAATSDASNQIADLQRQVNALKGKTIDIVINTTNRVVTSYSGDTYGVHVPGGYVGQGRHGLVALEKYETGGVRIQPDGSWAPKQWTSGGGLPRVPMVAKESTGLGLINWAEPGTGGEAFVPLGAQNRDRSKDLVRYLAGYFGGVASFETGGVLAPAGAPGYRSTGGGYGGGYPMSMQPPVVEVNARVFLGNREITDVVDTRIETKLKGTVRTARAAGKGRPNWR
jgi:TP901 family phage tail tape measure protein